MQKSEFLPFFFLSSNLCCAKSLQLYLPLYDAVDCCPPGSSVHGILQARIRSGLPCPPPGDLPDPGIKPKSFKSPVWQVDPLLLAPPGKPKFKPTFFQVASPLLDLIESFGETKSQASNKDFPQSSQVSIEKLKEKYCLCLLEIIRRASRLLRGVICFLWVKCIFIFYIKRYLKCLC